MAEKSAVNWERKLNIRTGAASFEPDDRNHSRYEPTPYGVLERLARQGGIKRENVLVDYGCGKGRVSFLMHHLTGCRTIGVEYNPELHAAALENLASYAGGGAGEISFECVSAESYVPSAADCFYFFNPFSERILQGVLSRILESWYARPRRLRLYVYYAVDEWLNCLMAQDMLSFIGEIDCRDLFHNPDPREKILVFGIDAPG